MLAGSQFYGEKRPKGTAGMGVGWLGVVVNEVWRWVSMGWLDLDKNCRGEGASQADI